MSHRKRLLQGLQRNAVTFTSLIFSFLFLKNFEKRARLLLKLYAYTNYGLIYSANCYSTIKSPLCILHGTTLALICIHSGYIVETLCTNKTNTLCKRSGTSMVPKCFQTIYKEFLEP